MDFTTTGGALGAFVSGVDLRQPLDQAASAEILAGLGEHGVLFFRDQAIDPEHHIGFAESLGTINVNRYFAANEDHPQIAEVRTEPTHEHVIGEKWHTDHSYDQEPALGSILVARELPPHGGGTGFANMYASFEALSDGLQATLRSMRAVHSSDMAFGAGLRKLPKNQAEGRFQTGIETTPDVVHPVVIEHPISGRPVLYVNMSFTYQFEGWTREESLPLLEYLFAFASQERFVYHFDWEPGSIAMWDNRCTWHKAAYDYQGHRRLMHRITLDGGPIAAASPVSS